MAATHLTTRTRLTGGAAAGGLALLLAACGGSSPAKATNSGTSGTSPSAAGGSAAAGTPVTVTETEFAIALPQMTFSPGTYTFTVLDKGHATHALKIDGPGVASTSSSTVNGGQSTTLTVTLQKGTYRLYCPVGNHASLGMDTKVTVS